MNRKKYDKGIYIEKSMILVFSLTINVVILVFVPLYLISNKYEFFDKRTNYTTVHGDKDRTIIHSRGMRNNNPLNIRYSPRNRWLGEVKRKRDFEFEEFVSVEFGFRAAYKTLMTYRNKYKIKTIEGIILRFSPPNENKTEDIINKISKMSGIPRDKVIRESDYAIIIKNMAIIESGKSYPIEVIEKGMSIK